ncbi:MAG TPA: SCO family protein [Methylotenera sp.]|nr:SCO family protein [Methylotenera sp.]HPH05507.1 SCO family protein [Methylotenera sp.]HPN00079.1 SCO family protein [Methylotenera sp.]
MRKLILLVLLVFLGACNPTGGQNSAGTSFIGQDITGADFAKPLALTDHTGKPRTMSDFKGKVVMLFFGYTHCPDVCPTTLSDLKQTMKLLGDKANEVQVLFITVDPERDTQEVLAQFVPYFDARFIGLRGNAQETKDTLDNFKVYQAKVDEKADGSYVIDHSAGMYVYDKNGKIRLYMQYGQKPQEIAADIQKLL